MAEYSVAHTFCMPKGAKSNVIQAQSQKLSHSRRCIFYFK